MPAGKGSRTEWSNDFVLRHEIVESEELDYVFTNDLVFLVAVFNHDALHGIWVGNSVCVTRLSTSVHDSRRKGLCIRAHISLKFSKRDQKPVCKYSAESFPICNGLGAFCVNSIVSKPNN